MKNHLKASFIAVGNLNNSGSTNVREPLPELFGICDGAMQSWDRVGIPVFPTSSASTSGEWNTLSICS